MDAVNDVLLRGARALLCDRVSERRSITGPAARHVSYIRLLFIFNHVLWSQMSYTGNSYLKVNSNMCKTKTNCVLF